MSKENKTVWFPAKRYGWGWGPPNVWQGWLVIAVYVVVLTISALYFLRRQQVAAFMISAVVLTIALLIVCRLKGEKPEWRWGRRG